MQIRRHFTEHENQTNETKTYNHNNITASQHHGYQTTAKISSSTMANPPSIPGETFLHVYPHTKFFLGTPASGTAWASLAAFYGFGTVHLSSCRLLFTLDPPSTTPHTLSIPLAWVRRDRLHIRRPFFDTKHVSGILVPADVSNMPGTVFTVPGKPMQFRIEMLDPGRNDELCSVLRDLLADTETVARHTRALRDAVDNQLVPTDIHFAFVDPTDTRFLYLSTQMKPPPR